MGMGIGINAQKPDAGVIRGQQDAVACGVWFTSKGRAIPKMIKFQDAQGEIKTLTNVNIIGFKEKHYCGILTVEYECDTITEGRIQPFHLIFYVERKEWKILWKDLA